MNLWEKEAVLICCHLPQMLLMHFLSSLHMRCQVLTCESATRHLPCTSSSPSGLTGSLWGWGSCPPPSQRCSLSLAPSRAAPVPCCAPLPHGAHLQPVLGSLQPGPGCWPPHPPLFWDEPLWCCRCGMVPWCSSRSSCGAAGARGRAAEPVHLQPASAKEKEQLAV